MMKQTTKNKSKEIYIRVSNIEWNEGPEEGYTGPESFWFIINSKTYHEVKDDPINKLALFQEIENQLENPGEYGGIASDGLEFEFVHPEWLKDPKHYKNWGLKKDDTIEVTDLTDKWV